MFSSFFGKKKAEPPVTVLPEPIRDDYVIVGNTGGGGQHPHQPPSNTFYPQLPPHQGYPGGGTAGGPPMGGYQPSRPAAPPIARSDSVSSKHIGATEGIPFKIASNFQSGDAFTDTIRRQIGDLTRTIERVEGHTLDYDFQLEKDLIC